jgi:hypothetical protein
MRCAPNKRHDTRISIKGGLNLGRGIVAIFIFLAAILEDKDNKDKKKLPLSQLWPDNSWSTNEIRATFPA